MARRDEASSVSPLIRVVRDPVLRRVGVAFGVFSLAETATWLAMLVAAYERGGTSEAGALAVAALAAAVVVAPFAAFAGDRFAPHRALSVGFVGQAIAMLAAAGALAADVVAVAYAAMIMAAAAITLTRPVVASLLPSVTSRPPDLVAANVVMSAASDVGLFAGPLAAGLLLAIGSPATVFACFGVLLASVAIGVGRIRLLDARNAPRSAMTIALLRREVVAGVATLARNRTLRLVVLVVFSTGVSVGAVDVMVVSLADGRLAGSVNVGVLAAAVGFGAFGGSLLASAFMARPGLAWFLGAGAAAMVLPLVVVAGSDEAAVIMGCLAVVGAGQSLVVVTGHVALQRWTDPAVVARVFGVQESLAMLAIACGTAVFTLAARSGSVRTAVLVSAAAVLLIACYGVVRIVATGADVPPPPTELVDRLRADPIFAPLDVRAIERLARGSSRMSVTSGTALITTGETGDRYYLVVDGRLRVSIDGEEVRTLGPGSSFGEIALLRDVPRTATVTTATPTELIAVERSVFLDAVIGHPSSASVAHAVVDRYREQ